MKCYCCNPVTPPPPLLLPPSLFDYREQRQLLERCAETALSSKLLSHHKSFFAKMVVDAVMLLDDRLPLDMIGTKKVPGGSMVDSHLVAGVAFKKTFSYAGFEMQPKRYQTPKIALLNVELELKAERANAEVRVDKVEVSLRRCVCESGRVGGRVIGEDGRVSDG